MSFVRAPVNVLVEGLTDEPVARRILEHAGLAVGTIFSASGSGELDRRLPRYNAAAVHTPWFVLRDLDRHPCPVTLRETLLPQPSSKMMFRIAVREVESWLLADRKALCAFFKLAEGQVPEAPDALADPKARLVQLGMRSRDRRLREGMTPIRGAPVGREYTQLVTAFALGPWRPAVAARHSESLRRCIRALESWR